MQKFKASSRSLLIAVWAAVLAGCSTQARRVDCDGRLQPINTPAPLIGSSSVPAQSGQTP